MLTEDLPAQYFQDTLTQVVPMSDFQDVITKEVPLDVFGEQKNTLKIGQKLPVGQ